MLPRYGRDLGTHSGLSETEKKEKKQNVPVPVKKNENPEREVIVKNNNLAIHDSQSMISYFGHVFVHF